jgi:phosphoribosylformylglycinamidine synthase PurS subunit
VRYAAIIHVRPRPDVRDPQGETIAAALRSLGHEIADVRTGKEIVVTLVAPGEEAATAEARRMGDELLANPVIEEFAVEVRPV